MAFDTPARIAIVGAGPIGLEAALYARFLGYDVDVYEQGLICQHVRQWQDVRMFSPFGMNCSTLGLAALAAQDPSYRPPRDEQSITGREWLENYLLPLAETDLIADHIQPQTKVVAIGRGDRLKNEGTDSEHRTECGFRLLVQSNGREENKEADIVIDASGVLSQPNWIGGDGAPALGEIAARRKNDELPLEQKFWHTDIPVGVEQTARFADKSILVVGAGCSAATTISELANLAKAHAASKVVWITRAPASPGGPISQIGNDQLPSRVSLAETVNQLAASGPNWLCYLGGTVVESIEFDESQAKCHVRFSGASSEELAFDQIIAQVGYRPNLEIFRELQVQLDYATAGLMGLTAAPDLETGVDAGLKAGGASLITTEPNFYVLGVKSYGRNSSFLFSSGLSQIRQLYSLIVDRAELDLYATSRNLLPKN